MTLELFPKHPEADAYRVGGAYQPYAIVGVDKRFTDAELAAEAYRQNIRAIGECGGASVMRDEGGQYLVLPHDVTTYGPMRREVWQSHTLIRFATQPHASDTNYE